MNRFQELYPRIVDKFYDSVTDTRIENDKDRCADHEDTARHFHILTGIRFACHCFAICNHNSCEISDKNQDQHTIVKNRSVRFNLHRILIRSLRFPEKQNPVPNQKYDKACTRKQADGESPYEAEFQQVFLHRLSSFYLSRRFPQPFQLFAFEIGRYFFPYQGVICIQPLDIFRLHI